MNEEKLRDKPYSGMGNVSKSKGLYKKKIRTMEDIIKQQFWLQKRLDRSLISEAGHGYSLITSLMKGDPDDFNFKKILEKDYRIWWMADCISWAIAHDYHVELDPEETKLLFQINEEILEMKEKRFAELKKEKTYRYYFEVPHVVLLSSEIRDMLNKPKLSNNEIHSLMHTFSEAKFERLSKRLRIDKESNTFYQAGEFVNITGRIMFVGTGNLSNRNKIEEYAYLVVFDTKTSLDFFYSIRLGFFNFRASSYYQMSGGAQQIFRFVGWSEGETYLTLEQLCSIAKIKSKDRDGQIRRIRRYLNELKKGKFIQGWHKSEKKIEGVRKRKITFTIFKKKDKYLPKK